MQIKKQIVAYIHERGLQAHDQLASQGELAKHFSTSLLTVHRALAELIKEGVLYTRKGVGTFVAKGAAKKRNAISLILPGEGLDQPENNPEYWPYVQMLLRCFLAAAGSSWIFSPRPVISRDSAQRLAAELQDHAAVFFLHHQDEWGLFDLLLRERIAPVVCLGLPHPSRPCLT
ncbi:MAG: GntR family transcriptional regulator, partial [Planctomycetota bacterium]|nr:GntR family transcriptional regulator [Planctomycetota bacterium]